MEAKKWVKQRKRGKHISMMQFFLLGAEFSLITPTLAFYLEELRASDIPVYFGIVLGLYSASAIVSTLILSRFMDTTLRFKRLITLVNAITLFGNALYTTGRSPYTIFLARFLSGVIEAIYPIIYGELARCYTVDEFPRHAAHLMTAYCFGFSISPGFSMVPDHFLLNLGFVNIRYTNAPGAILFILYFMQLLVAVSGLTDLSLDKQRYGVNVSYLSHIESREIDDLKYLEGERDILITENSDISHDHDANTIVSESPWWDILFRLMTRKEILILLYGQLVWAYTLMNGMVLLPTTAVRYLQLNHQVVSMFYIGYGITNALLLFLNSKFIARHGPVKTCVAAFLMNFLASLCLYLTVLAEHLSFPIRTSFFILFGLLMFLGWYLNSVAIKATLSKHVAMVDQTFCQGLFATVDQVTVTAAAFGSGFVFSIMELYCLWSIAINLAAVFIFVIFYNDLECVDESSVSVS